MEEQNKQSLSDKMKKVNWELTKQLHLNDGKHYGGAVWLYLHRDVQQKVKEAYDKLVKNDFINTSALVVPEIKKVFEAKFGFNLN